MINFFYNSRRTKGAALLSPQFLSLTKCTIIWASSYHIHSVYRFNTQEFDRSVIEMHRQQMSGRIRNPVQIINKIWSGFYHSFFMPVSNTWNRANS